MKSITKILVLMLSVALSFMLIACGDKPCTEHEDTNPADGKCDSCGAVLAPEEGGEGEGEGEGGEGETPAGDLALIKNGEASFQFVLGEGAGGNVRSTLNNFKNKMKSKYGITVNVVDDVAGNEMDCEVLIGTVTSRGATYEYDMYSLGLEGSVIKAIGTKIIVGSGDPTLLSDMVNEFLQDYIGFDEGSDEFLDVTLTEDDWYEEIQDGYYVESIKVSGVDIKGYTISYPTDEKNYFKTQALALQETLYEETGYFLPARANAESDRSIEFRHVDKSEIKNGYGFEVSVEGTKLVIKCAHKNSLETAMNEFVRETILIADKGTNLDFGADYKWSKVNIGIVKYKDFGVDDKGIYNAYPGIKAAHDFANEGGQTVVGEYGARYLIDELSSDGKTYETIKIMTDVDWRGATFIIDDTDALANGTDPDAKINVFTIVPPEEVFVHNREKYAAYKENGLPSSSTHFDIGLGFPAMLRLINNYHKVYIRYGGNQNDGAAQSEVILIDENGKIDESTPLLFDYETLTGCLIYRRNVEAVTVRNATFRSLASQVNLVTDYYSIARGISIQRPGTTLSDITHIIENEKAKGELVNDVPFIGHSYNGFVQVQNTTDVTVENVVFQSRVYYLQGTYDITLTYANNVTFKDCTQSNFYRSEEGQENVPNTSRCWGVMGSNYCKNMVYDGCQLTRYDAHSGVVNGKIINSEVSALTLIGGGDMLIENTKIHHTTGSGIISLRPDYGSTWKGTITIRNSTAYDSWGTVALYGIVTASIANHDFGYDLYFPNIIIDNLTITHPADIVHIVAKSTAKCSHRNADGSYAVDQEKDIGLCSLCNAYVYRSITLNTNLHLDEIQDADGRPNQSPYIPPEYIKVFNNKNKGYVIQLYDVPFFENTVIEGDIEKVPLP